MTNNTNNTNMPRPLTDSEKVARDQALKAAGDTKPITPQVPALPGMTPVTATATAAKPVELKPGDKLDLGAGRTVVITERVTVDAAGKATAKPVEAKVLPDLTAKAPVTGTGAAKTQGSKATTLNPHTAPVAPQGNTKGGKKGKVEIKAAPVTPVKLTQREAALANPHYVLGYDLAKKWPVITAAIDNGKVATLTAPSKTHMLVVRALLAPGGDKSAITPITSRELSLAYGFTAQAHNEVFSLQSVAQAVGPVMNRLSDHKHNVYVDMKRWGLIDFKTGKSKAPDADGKHRATHYATLTTKGLFLVKRAAETGAGNGGKAWVVPSHLLPQTAPVKPANGHKPVTATLPAPVKV